VPGEGVLSTDGILPFSTTLDQPGVFARNVEDAALLVAHLAHSRWTISPQIVALKHAPRLVGVRSPVWHLADEDQRGRFAADLAGLREAGAVVDEIDLPPSFNDAHKVHRSIMLYEGAAASRAIRAVYAARLSELLRKAMEEGDRISVAEYERALKKRDALHRDFSRFLDDYDAVVTPPAAGEAPGPDHGRRPVVLYYLDAARCARSRSPGLGRHGLPPGLQVVGNQGESTTCWQRR
jgi:Asp-tRNA(Asn)/Glu-tRNA(Gln) amidotransferase A subunit family amidase